MGITPSAGERFEIEYAKLRNLDTKACQKDRGEIDHQKTRPIELDLETQLIIVEQFVVGESEIAAKEYNMCLALGSQIGFESIFAP